MSRIIKLKYSPRVPAKVVKRRGSNTSTSSSSLNLSDDDGYSGVDDVSDSDEGDEDHVNAAEEEHLTRAGRKHSQSPRSFHHHNSHDSEEGDVDDDDDEVNAEEEEDREDEDEKDDNGYQKDANNDRTSWNGFMSDVEDGQGERGMAPYDFGQHAGPIERRVRFAGVPDSDSDSTDTDVEDADSFFPDIFVEQNQLDPAFRREIEYDDDSSSSASFWDFSGGWEQSEGDLAPAAPVHSDIGPRAITPGPSYVPDAMNTSIREDEIQELDGYETDGDTTEEDIPELIARKKQARTLVPTAASSDSDAQRPVRARRGHPRTGKFSLDDMERKPIAVCNPLTRKMMIFTPQKRCHFDLSPESFNISYMNNLSALQSSPIFSNPASLMMSAMVSSNTFGDFVNTTPFGPAEAFFPFHSDATMDDSDEFDVEDEEDEHEKSLELDDFITFDSEPSDNECAGEAEGQTRFEGECAGSLVATPQAKEDDVVADMETPTRRPRSVSSASAMSRAKDGLAEMHPLLNHFSNHSDAVGAFRRNQINQQLILSDKATKESLAFSGPLYHGTLRGIKAGSMQTVNTPITPVRRRKSNSLAGLTAPSNTESTLLISLSQKRKASETHGAEEAHKRHRSISDMEVLQI